jgi:hypothetical protein
MAGGGKARIRSRAGTLIPLVGLVSVAGACGVGAGGATAEDDPRGSVPAAPVDGADTDPPPAGDTGPAEDTDGGTDETAEPCAVWAEVGTGELAWTPLRPLDEVELVHGPQGGWHVVWSARVSGLQPSAELRRT